MTTSNSANFKYVYSDGNDTFDYDKFFKGNFQLTDDLMFNGSQYVKQLSAPVAPTVTPVGTVGTTTYSYYVVAIDKAGNKTLPSPVGSTTTGNATLSATNYNTITWSPVTGAVAYDLLRGDTGHSIVTNLAATTFNDIGIALTAYTVPTRNATGDLKVDGIISTNGSSVPVWLSPSTLNGWVFYGGVGSNYAPQGYYKDALGNVHVKGIIASGTAAPSTVLFNLPSGYRPKETRYFSGWDGALVQQRLEVDSNGDVKIASLSNINNAFLTLDQIQFPAEQ